MTRWSPWFVADWERAVFMHFRADARQLQGKIPFELDKWNGQAIVSLVAFTQSRLRPAGFGRLGEWLSKPLARHEFLNLRTYVRCGDDRGIFFLSEWIPNRLAVEIGPRTYGLPYHLGKLRYACDLHTGSLAGLVRAGAHRLAYRGRFEPADGFHTVHPGTLDHFLVERYVAFTSRRGVTRSFRIEHNPWPIVPAKIEMLDTTLVDPIGQPIYSHFSPGVGNVHIGGARKTDFGAQIVYT